jgi:uncharacterized protein YyaL (SSP411 family)
VAQQASGEFFYLYPSRPHYLCYQYNAYQLINLLAVFERCLDPRVLELARRCAEFLRCAQNVEGSCRNSCLKAKPEFDYHTAALAHAYLSAYRAGLGEEYLERSQRAFAYLLSHQRPDGGWRHSTGDYGGLLSDGRSYPRYLAMTLFHLLQFVQPVAERTA